MRLFAHNPIGFTAGPVTIICTTVYAALIALLVYQHGTLPTAKEIPGIDLDKAWQDLSHLTAGFHPYNSQLNEQVRHWLLQRIDQILGSSGVFADDSTQRTLQNSQAFTTVFQVDYSNTTITMSPTFRRAGFGVYFEGANIIVYIRGTNDDPEEWWTNPNKYPSHRNGVLINAHFDSVSTGYGATDDGVGTLVILQIINYFSKPENQPKNGIIALINNGEEDGLYGSRAFLKHPMSRLVATFLNLEGAGAGGRATLFRSTDAEVTKAYQYAPLPFGSVTSADAFKRGIIKSDTDYTVFNAAGFRGLDVAFFAPRASYHTIEDDVRHTSRASLYHMMSASLEVMKYLTDTTHEIVNNGEGPKTEGVWFHLFGRLFTVFRLNTLFAMSISAVILAPLIIIVTAICIRKTDHLYIFNGATKLHLQSGSANLSTISIKGLRGLLRGPLAFITATVATFGCAIVVDRLNPFIVYSSPFAVWSMMISCWLFVSYVVMRVSHQVRPTALHRLYSLLWTFAIAWIIMVIGIVLERRAQIAGAFLVLFYFLAVFTATELCLLEQLGTPKKSNYALDQAGVFDEVRADHVVVDNSDQDEDATTATEASPLIGASRVRQTFNHHTSQDDAASQAQKINSPGQHLEQAWSLSMPTSLWIVEFLILAPLPLIFLGQEALMLTSAMSQTLADGNDPAIVYAAFAALTILIFLPLHPFIHRFTYHIPLLLFLVLIGTSLYNLLAFPFSANNRLKVLFHQRVDLNTGQNNVSLIGISSGSYLQQIMDSLPSVHVADSKDKNRVHCAPQPLRPGISRCSFAGLLPHPVTGSSSADLSSWVTVKIVSAFSSAKHNQTNDKSYSRQANFTISAIESKSCRILISSAHSITDFVIHKTASGPTTGTDDITSSSTPTDPDTKQILLWSRRFNATWTGTFTYIPTVERSSSNGNKSTEARLEGEVYCIWSDANRAQDKIPALAEAWQYAPTWAVVSKFDDGLVEGWKRFVL